MKKLILLTFVLLMASMAFAGDVSFTVVYDFGKNTPCSTATQTLCVQDIVIYDTLTGTRHVDFTVVAPTTANTLTTINTPTVTLKDVYGPVVFACVARARDSAGNLIESVPTVAPSASLAPGAVVSLIAK